MVVIVKRTTNMNASSPTSTATAAQRYMMNYSRTSLQNLAEWRQRVFVKNTNTNTNTNKEVCDKGEKNKNIQNECQPINIHNLDIYKVINSLSIHLEEKYNIEKNEKIIDKKRGKIKYNTRDGRILYAFHSVEHGKIICDDNVYDSMRLWLEAANVAAPSRGE